MKEWFFNKFIWVGYFPSLKKDGISYTCVSGLSVTGFCDTGFSTGLNDIASLNKHKENGAKGGKKRAENYRNKSFKPVEKPETQIAKETPITSVETEAPEYKVASFFYDYKYRSQLNFLIKRPFSPRANQQVYKNYMLNTYPENKEEIENSI